MIILKVLEVVWLMFWLFLFSFVPSEIPKLYREYCKEKGKKEAKNHMAWCLPAMWAACLLPSGIIWHDTNFFLAGLAAFVFCGSLSTYFALKEAKWAKLRAQKISTPKGGGE
jgi:hypothetical protein